MRRFLDPRHRGPLKRTSEVRRGVLFAALAVALLVVQSSAWGQMSNRAVEASANEAVRGSSQGSDLLRQFNTSLVTLTKQVTPAVVQITVTSYGPIDHSSESHDVALIARQHGIGSGVILDRDTPAP